MDIKHQFKYCRGNIVIILCNIAYSNQYNIPFIVVRLFNVLPVTPWFTPPYAVVHRAKNLYTLKPKAEGCTSS